MPHHFQEFLEEVILQTSEIITCDWFLSHIELILAFGKKLNRQLNLSPRSKTEYQIISLLCYCNSDILSTDI